MRSTLLITGVVALVLGARVTPSEATDPDGKVIRPLDVATDPGDNVYVDSSSNIQKFTSAGDFIAEWGSLGSGIGQFDSGWGIGTDTASNVYVADGSRYEFNEIYRNNRIQKFASDGTFITTWGSYGSGDGQFSFAFDVATDPSGYVYVADTDNGRIQKFTSDGTFIAEFGKVGVNGEGRLGNPRRIATDPAGNVYVTDQWLGGSIIQKFSSDGTFLTSWGGYGQSEYPWGIATDTAGNVYVTDLFENYVQKFTSDGMFITQWGSQGSGDGQFEYPSGIATDTVGNVYVADTDSDRIQKFASDGTFITKWGGGSTESETPVSPPAPRVSRPRITTGPGAKTISRSATFGFSSSQSGVDFECRLGGHGAPASSGDWIPCASPQRYSNLRLGGKIFSVRAIKAGSTSAAATWNWTIIRRTAGRKPLVLPTTRRRATFRASCGFDYRCRAQVTAKAGRKVLARGHYSIPAHSSHRVSIALTGTGRMALAHMRRVRARLTIVDTRTHKRETLPVVLRRR